MSNISETINQLNTAASAVTLTLSLVSCVPGVIGLILNLLVFTRPALRHEPCSVYFFSSTCFNLSIVLIFMPVRTISSSLNIGDIADYNLSICKIEFYACYVVSVISCWLITLACIDRYLHSSINMRMRRLSSLRTARIAVGIISILFIILYSPMIIYYEIANMTDDMGQTKPECNPRNCFYSRFIACWHMTFYSLCPSFLMLLFGFLTLNNIRQQRRVLPVIGEHTRITRRTDRQLLRMLAAQVLVIIISTLPLTIDRLYASFTESVVKDALRIAQENLASQIANTMAYFAHTCSFYLYTLTGRVFRKELFKILACCSPHHLNPVRLFRDQRNQILALQVNRQAAVMANASIK